MPAKSSNIMLIYGHCDPLIASVEQLIRLMGLNPMSWNELVLGAGGGAVHNLDIVRQAFDQVQATVVILYGEEEVKPITQLVKPSTKPRKSYQPRPNVIFEVGMALRFMPRSTFLLQFSPLRIWSDIDGLHRIDFQSDEIEKRQELFLLLQKAGCDVNDRTGKHIGAKLDFTCVKSRLS